MTPEEMLAEGVKTNNWDLVKKAQSLLVPQPKSQDVSVPASEYIVTEVVARKPRKKRVTKEKVGAVKGKTQGAKGDAHDMAQYVARLEKERYEQIIQEGGRQVKAGAMTNVDFNGAFAEDKKLDKLLNPKQTRKSTPRDSVEYVTQTCPICNRPVEVISTQVRLYAWSGRDEEKSKPLYRCDKCMG